MVTGSTTAFAADGAVALERKSCMANEATTNAPRKPVAIDNWHRLLVGAQTRKAMAYEENFYLLWSQSWL
ncbi:MAG TPA: hypothetical protein ACN46O_04475 [Prochlorococcus sp.]